jgi:hypothetical protein
MSRLTDSQASKTKPFLSQRSKAFGLKVLSETKEKDPEWIWYPYLSRGEMTLVEGDPEAKKSFLIQAAARSLMDGRPLPSKWPDLQPPPGNVVLFDCENDGETVLKKRFRYLGLKNEGRLFYKEDPFQMVEDDIEMIIDGLRVLKPLMVVFDTMNDYLDAKANSNNGKEVAQALQPFKRMAKELNCAVVLIRHLNKGGGKAMYRGQASITFAGKARIAITVAADPENPETSLFVPVKCSNAPKPLAREYHVFDRSEPDARSAFRFSWGDEVEKTADELLEVPRDEGRPPKEREEAKNWLLGQLESGPVAVRMLKQEASRRALAWKTVERAASDLGVIKPKGGANSAWKMRAPA